MFKNHANTNKYFFTKKPSPRHNASLAMVLHIFIPSLLQIIFSLFLHQFLSLRIFLLNYLPSSNILYRWVTKAAISFAVIVTSAAVLCMDTFIAEHKSFPAMRAESLISVHIGNPAHFCLFPTMRTKFRYDV